MPRLPHILTAALFTAVASFSLPAQAQQRPVVVELFTSQGCSSCPPADAILSALRERDDVIAIALHVDYWDYIGWKDEFGDPAHAKRQRAYALKAGRRSIYTPQMIVNGRTDIVGAKPMVLSKVIAHYKETPSRMQLSVTRAQGGLQISGTVPTGAVGAMEIHVAAIIPSQTTNITHGENSSKTFEYTNIAQNWRIAGHWNGQGPLAMSIDSAEKSPIVVLVQEADAGPIVAAALVD